MTGVELIAQERERQVKKEKWDSAHDDRHTDGSLAAAAATYALNAVESRSHEPVKRHVLAAAVNVLWPWHPQEHKVKSTKRNLVRAGALIAAELDRLNRLEKKCRKK